MGLPLESAPTPPAGDFQHKFHQLMEAYAPYIGILGAAESHSQANIQVEAVLGAAKLALQDSVRPEPIVANVPPPREALDELLMSA